MINPSPFYAQAGCIMDLYGIFLPLIFYAQGTESMS